MRSDFIIVAIDGGAAAGKSSTARALGKRFNLLHADTGSYFRAVTSEMIRLGVSAGDLPAVRSALQTLRLGTRITGRSAEMEIAGRVAGHEIRGTEINSAVSHFAAIPELRATLLTYERGQAALARSGGFRGLVMDGRDIGSVIFPNADFRFFLHADPAERTRRRVREGHHDAVAERDRIDSSRSTAPLSCPDGAISIDSTHLTLEEVIDQMAEFISGKDSRPTHRIAMSVRRSATREGGPSKSEMEPLYGISHAFIRMVYEILFRGEIAGLENLPAGGGYIVASNHASLLDPPLVGLYIPQQVTFFARKTLWKGWLASWWLNGVGTIPVDRDGGTDVIAIKRVLQTLRLGKVVILFPEGTRSRDGKLQRPRPGVGLIACRTGMPVVPARVFGSFDAFGRDGKLHFGTPVSVRYGRPLTPGDYDRPGDGKERYARAAERIMAAIEKIEPPSLPVV